MPTRHTCTNTRQGRVSRYKKIKSFDAFAKSKDKKGAGGGSGGGGGGGRAADLAPRAADLDAVPSKLRGMMMGNSVKKDQGVKKTAPPARMFEVRDVWLAVDDGTPIPFVQPQT